MKVLLILKVLLLSVGIYLSGLGINLAGAQPPFQNPLQVEKNDDPLLPELPVNRSLSPLERLRLAEQLEQLNQRASATYEEGNVDEAFNIWYRELRLRQELEVSKEVEALGRVGEIAWRENRSEDLRNIRQRLSEIETTAKDNNNRDLLQQLAKTYETMRINDRAIAVYNFLREDSDNSRPLLEKIASLYESRFQDEQAAQTYETLLANFKNNPRQEINYLRALNHAYEQTDNLEKSLTTKERLISQYQEQNNEQALPSLFLALGEDYQKMGQFNSASNAYEQAYRRAWSQQKYAIASESLDNLAQLYRRDESLETTLNIYEQLLIVQERASNFYGLMMTYNNIGEVHQERDRDQQALAAFENALEIAQSLGYQEAYFQEKINNLI
mgnify:CR=1 FL=1